MRAFAVAVAGTIAAAVLAGVAGAAFTPAEQAWLTPLLRIWNDQNDHLKVVVGQAEARNALIVGTKPNETLTFTLAALASCKEPRDLIRQAGPPPSARLEGFRGDLNAACIDDLSGANDFAKAIGAARRAEYALGSTLLRSGLDAFVLGRDALARAYVALARTSSPAAVKA
jgi:hypothetical protein